MSVDVEAPAGAKINFFTLRLAAAVIAGGGVLSIDAASAVAVEADRGKRPLRRIDQALRPLVDDDVLVRVDDTWYATNLADLAAWLADAVEAREDAGMLINPTIPAPRSGERTAA